MGNILLKKQFHGNSSTTGVGFNITTVNNLFSFKTAFYKIGDFALPTRVTQRGVIYHAGLPQSEIGVVMPKEKELARSFMTKLFQRIFVRNPN